MEFAIGTVVVAVLVRQLVDALQLAGLPSRDAPIAAGLCGLTIGAIAGFAAGDTTFMSELTAVLLGLSAGLGAVGVDASVKRVTGGT